MAKAKATAAKKPAAKGKAQKPIAENVTSSEEPKEATQPEVEEIQSAEPAPNIIWLERYGTPPAVVKVGIRSIPVPEADRQLAGFYSPDARALVRNINGYKFLQSKG